MGSEQSVKTAKSDPCLPVPRSVEYEWMSIATWRAMHAEDVAIAAKGQVDLLLVGDSITQGWHATKVWAEKFGQYRSANFGIGGDATQNLLWRLQNGDVGRLSPKLIVVLIGINNLGREEHSPEETCAGVLAVVDFLRKAFPQSRILLNAILPPDREPGSAFRAKAAATNRLLRPKAAELGLEWLDATQAILEPDGRLTPEISHDALHLTEEGYRRWANVLAPEVERLMK
jgi:lysophospholipase L1-like esterase